MPDEKSELLALTEKSYDEYNQVLVAIKKRLGPKRTRVFEQALGCKLETDTARTAYRCAILAALGEIIVVKPPKKKVMAAAAK